MMTGFMRMTLISSLAACFGRFITDKNEKIDFRRYLMDEISIGDTDKNKEIYFGRCLKGEISISSTDKNEEIDFRRYLKVKPT